MYKYESDGPMKKRLQEHIRSRGYPAWLSVTTSPSGSYREHDVLDFLEHHLPRMGPGRRWRISLADDYGPHKAKNVSNLCWNRGYVHQTHGGGATPVTQTPDTHLNQHIRRNYKDEEGRELIHQMRMGCKVPKLAPEQSIDVMVKVLSQKQLHLHAADGYKETGMNVALDGTEDHMIVNEAGRAWRAIGMREKTNQAVKQVEREYAAGRLTWCKRDVLRLIAPYPRHEKCDKILEAQGEHAGLMGEGEAEPNDEEEVDASDEDSDSASDASGPSAAVAAEGDSASSAPMGPSMDVVLVEDGAAAAAAIRSAGLVDTYTKAIESLRECGAVVAASQLENERHKEERRQRNLQKEDPTVAEAFQRHRELQALDEMRERQIVNDANNTRRALSDARKALKETSETLRKRKAQVMDAEKLLEAQHCIRNFSLESLGQGKARSGGGPARKQRALVLDRFSRLGSGLSTPQKNDWAWFKEAWDEKMSQQHKDNWGGIFAAWMQRVLDDIQEGAYNAFSIFVNTETMRCLRGAPMLSIPGS